MRANAWISANAWRRQGRRRSGSWWRLVAGSAPPKPSSPRPSSPSLPHDRREKRENSLPFPRFALLHSLLSRREGGRLGEKGVGGYEGQRRDQRKRLEVS